MEIVGSTLYDTWIGLNNAFIRTNPDNSLGEKFILMARRDYAMFKSNIVLKCDSLWLPDKEFFLFKKEKRIQLLHKRYLDPVIWQEGVDRLTANKYQNPRFYPKSFLFQFHHRGKISPTGGGCLVAFILYWFDSSWHLHVFSRMTEITINLLADMYFIQSLILDLINDKHLQGVKNFPLLDTIWTFTLTNQKRDRIPPYLLYTGGDSAVKKFMSAKPKNRWQKCIQDNFWDTFIYPEKVNWAQRLRWTNKFLENTKIDWRKLKNENK